MKKLQDLFIKKKKSLVLAESCTGGLIASILTRTAGSSNYFVGSFVTYTDAMKQKILGVSQRVLKEKSAVSEEVCARMSIGALEKSGADIAVAVTGDAGPDGARVGLVFGSIATKEKTFVGKIPGLDGLSRNEVQEKCAAYLLDALYAFAKDGKVPFDN
ncbi:CinA family protein [bacterium]|nr:CinA family protein [bacterium]